MNEACSACLAGPVGIEGHAQLRVERMVAAAILFRCSRCGLLWSRPYSVNASHVWSGPHVQAAPQEATAAGSSRAVSRRTTS